MNAPKLCFVIFLFLLSLSFSGCFELMETEGVGGLSETTVLPDDAAVLSDADLTINGEGRLVAGNELSLNKLLGEIELRRIPGENPKLYIKGRSAPFGEVLSEENKVRILEYNKEFGLSSTIYSVEGERVFVRANAEIASNNVVATVYKGNLVVTLSEENGWYQVKVVQNSRITYGWIEAQYLAPVVTGTVVGNNCEKDRTGNISFTNKMRVRCVATLYSGNTPQLWIGTPGLGNSGQVTLEPGESQSLYNIKAGVYILVISSVTYVPVDPTYWNSMPDGEHTRKVYNTKKGQVLIEICQTVNHVIR